MDTVFLTALLSPCLPFLMKLGDKAIESAGSKIGTDVWETATKIWDRLYPKLAEKEDAKLAAEQVAAKPESEARRNLLAEELEILFKENPDLAAAISQILQNKSATSAMPQISQMIGHVEGQVIGQQTGGQSFGQVHGGKIVGQVLGDVENINL